MASEPVRKYQFDPSKIFQPDALAPAQFYATTRRTYRAEPELRLMAAVLEDAVATLSTDQSRCSKRQRREYHEVVKWITKRENDDWVFSFVNVCESLALDPDYLRDGLLRKPSIMNSAAANLPTAAGRRPAPRRKVVRLRTG